MMNILFLEVDAEDVSLVKKKLPQAQCIEESALSEQKLIETCRDAKVISCFIHSHFTEKIVNQLPNLRLLCTRSVGYDHIDLAACRKRGIIVCNVPDYGSYVIAEHVFALLLSTLRHVPEGDRKVEGGTFDYHGLRGMALHGKTIGIIGTGSIGRTVAQIAQGFDMKILAYDTQPSHELQKKIPSLQYVTLHALITHSDIISLHIPETPATHHIIDATAIAQMKVGVIIINTARGSLIDRTALLAALQSKKVQYALLDVLEHEQNFEENKELIAHPRVVTTPHIAFYADDSMQRMLTESFHSIEEWTHGKQPTNVVH